MKDLHEGVSTDTAVDTLSVGRVGVGDRLRSAPLVVLLVLSFSLLFSGGCSSKPARATPETSTRLHVAAVVYAKYVSAHDGEMPANQEELAEFVESSEPQVLLRFGYKSAEDIFKPAEGEPRLVVLYRDQRDRLHTHFVAMEQQTVQGNEVEGQQPGTRWYAVDILGVPQQITEGEADRFAAAAEANKESGEAPAEAQQEGATDGGQKQS